MITISDYKELFSAISSGQITFGVIFGIVWLLLLIIGWWNIFAKADQGGWKSLIPIYNIYTLFKITWSTKVFFKIIILCIINAVSIAFLSTSDVQAISIIGGILVIITALMLLIYDIRLSSHIAKAYGKGLITTLILIFFESIGTLYLGYGGAKYEGPKN